jgi:hypothetical protein
MAFCMTLMDSLPNYHKLETVQALLGPVIQRKLFHDESSTGRWDSADQVKYVMKRIDVPVQFFGKLSCGPAAVSFALAFKTASFRAAAAIQSKKAKITAIVAAVKTALADSDSMLSVTCADDYEKNRQVIRKKYMEWLKENKDEGFCVPGQ